jgi:prevent-host-death family protein
LNEISATRFKARCLSLLNEVAEEGAELIVTKHGRPVARVVPVEAPASLTDSVTVLVAEDELLAPFSEPWDAAR